MGPGHLGIGFAAKTVSPELPLWAYLVGSEGLDLLSFVFLSTGMERFASYEITIEKGIETLSPGSISWSHGLFMSVIWSILASDCYLPDYSKPENKLTIWSGCFQPLDT